MTRNEEKFYTKKPGIINILIGGDKEKFTPRITQNKIANIIALGQLLDMGGCINMKKGYLTTKGGKNVPLFLNKNGHIAINTRRHGKKSPPEKTWEVINKVLF